LRFNDNVERLVKLDNGLSSNYAPEMLTVLSDKSRERLLRLMQLDTGERRDLLLSPVRLMVLD